MTELKTIEKQSPLQTMAMRLNVDPMEMESIVKNTIMPAKVLVSNEQFTAFLVVANEYGLNPLTREIYAFPAKGGGIQPIVGVDGWMSMINRHPQYNGMEFDDIRENGQLIAIRCRIYRKDRDMPISVTEYMDECRGVSEPWKRWPVRMLRHKVVIQTARYAFGFSGIMDEDEYGRMAEKEINPKPERSEGNRLFAKLNQSEETSSRPDTQPQPVLPRVTNTDNDAPAQPVNSKLSAAALEYQTSIQGAETTADLKSIGARYAADDSIEDWEKKQLNAVYMPVLNELREYEKHEQLNYLAERNGA